MLDPEDHWNTWDFDRHLQIRRPRPIPAEQFEADRAEMTREGLETLLLLNLGAVFPDWNLRPIRPPRAATTPPIEALDPAGVLHLFALHDVREAPEAVSRTLAEATERLGTSEVDRYFDADSEDRPRELASRIAAFWLDTEVRTDAVSISADRSPEEARRRRLEELVDRLDGDLAADRLVEQVRDMVAERDADDPWSDWPRAPEQLHLHFVIADHEELDEAETEVLERLRNQGVRTDVWEVRVDADRDRLRGRLGVRPIRFSDRRQKAFPALRDRRPTELLAEMSHQRPELHRNINNWAFVPNKKRTILRTALPLVDEPALGPFFAVTTRGDDIEFKASFKVPDAIDEAYSLTDLKTDVTPVSMAAVRAWIAGVLPPDPAEHAEAARRLEHFMHQGKRWGGYLRVGEAGPVVAATGWHSGGLRSATITVDTSELEPSLEDLATLADDMLETFIDKLLAEGGTPDGWAPPQTG